MADDYTAQADFLREAARYFEKRPTGGEDRAHWSNVYNAENCRKSADAIEAQAARIAELEAALDKASAALSWLLLEGVDEVIPDTCPAEYKICVDALSAARAALEGK